MLSPGFGTAAMVYSNLSTALAQHGAAGGVLGKVENRSESRRNDRGSHTALQTRVQNCLFLSTEDFSPSGGACCSDVFRLLGGAAFSPEHYAPVCSSNPFSSFSWHAMQCRVHGTASSRFGLISAPQEMHSPKVPSRIRSRAPSTICRSCRSLLL